MPATALLTIADLERMPDDAVHRELLHGELIELPPPKSNHAIIAANIYDAIAPFVKAGKVGRAFTEAGFRLFPDQQSWLQPDVSFLRAKRVIEADRDDYFEGAPDLAVEVISPSERATDIERKVRAYLDAGSSSIWLVFPPTRTIRIFRPGFEVTLTESDTLTEPALFPGWSFPVRSIFEN